MPKLVSVNKDLAWYCYLALQCTLLLIPFHDNHCHNLHDRHSTNSSCP